MTGMAGKSMQLALEERMTAAIPPTGSTNLMTAYNGALDHHNRVVDCG